jgi:probable rRNA maturation factor
MIQISFDDHTESGLDQKFAALIEKTVRQTLVSEGLSIGAEIGVSFVDNEEIRGINKKFRRIDRATDVLSFPLIDFRKESPLADGGHYELGDIILSYERAVEQANEFGHAIEREIAFLTAHSMLHLLGYDHVNAEEETKMFGKQDAILNELKIFR